MVKTSCSLLVVLVLSLGAIGAIEADDGWRRTARGWERSSNWQQADVAQRPVEVAKSDPIHPGQLAILQVTLSALVLGLFVSEHRNRSSKAV